MEIQIIWKDAVAFEAAVRRPEGRVAKENYGEYVSHHLEKAAKAEQERLDFQGIASGGKNSEIFHGVSLVEHAIMEHFKKYEYPKQVRVICDTEQMYQMYRVVYNFYFADTKAARMVVGEDK